jgi:hypothetical protein
MQPLFIRSCHVPPQNTTILIMKHWKRTRKRYSLMHRYQVGESMRSNEPGNRFWIVYLIGFGNIHNSLIQNLDLGEVEFLVMAK